MPPAASSREVRRAKGKTRKRDAILDMASDQDEDRVPSGHSLAKKVPAGRQVH